MAFTDQKSFARNPGAVAGVIVIHAAMGAALVTGLAGGVAGVIEDTVLTTYFIPDTPPPPPPPAPDVVKPDPVETSLVTPPVHVPTPPVSLSDSKPLANITPDIPDVIPDVLPQIVPKPLPTTTPGRALLDPVGVSPRNDPGSWVTPNDYRGRWINEELTGTASFRLDVGANGKVERCTITKSSGHAVLDEATCNLVTRRAKFRSAQDENGNKVSGSYTNSVRWQLPD
ncbi:MAG: TonB family protein [Sphingomonadaceae bacterium]|nr:TonB family protein [Sphingomonadaceae bacterium]